MIFSWWQDFKEKDIGKISYKGAVFGNPQEAKIELHYKTITTNNGREFYDYEGNV